MFGYISWIDVIILAFGGTMLIESFAKINIGLVVGNRRDDGFHEIESYFARISLCDYIDINVRKTDLFSCTISSDIDYLDPGKTDIMERCAKAFSDRTGVLFAINIDIEKNIPSKAGFGGGSSNGAAILEYLNTSFGNILNRKELMEVGLSCGSDIPFFLSEYSFAYVHGRGDIVERRDVPRGLEYALIFMPKDGISTSGAYSALDSLGIEPRLLPQNISYPIKKEDFPNDFEKIVDRNLLDELTLVYDDIAFVSLSGSGSGCYVLSCEENIEEVERIAPMDYAKVRII